MEGICADAGIILAFLPPYSPDLNPIEEAFAQLKAWVQKNRSMADNFDTYEGFLRCALEALKMRAKGHFWRCRIGRILPRDDVDMQGDFADDNED